MAAFDMAVWQGRVDAAEGDLGRRWHQVMQPLAPATPAATTVLLGFACDAGVARNHGRVGAAEGPRAIRRALANMPVHECSRLADGGDVVCAGDALEAAQQALAALVAQQLGAGRFPLVLGGGHEMAWGSFTGLGTHLALTEGANDETKGRYGFVFGDFRRLHRSALIACHFRAAEWSHKDIELAAHELLQALDASRGLVAKGRVPVLARR